MKRILPYLFAALAILFLVMNPNTYAQDRDSQSGFSEYREIMENNIFDASRQPRREAPPPRPTPPPAPRVDKIQLVGAMVTEDSAIAFFESNMSEARGPKRADEKLDDLTLGQISTSGVEFHKGDETLNLAIGQALERAEGEAWKNTGEIEIKRDAPASTSTKEAPIQADSPSDLLQKLRERRQQELTK
ncbi:MAG: hypothetical protein ACOCVT_00340 [bacterium]